MQDEQTPGTTGRGRAKAIWAALLTAALSGGAAFFLYSSKQPHYRKIEPAQSHIKAVKITGEVVDAWCYSSQTMGPGRGEGHKACALACSYGGITMGILEDGTKDLYIAAKYKGYHGCNELLIPYVAQKVTVTGWVGDLGGNRMLRIDTVTPLETKTDQTKTDQLKVKVAPEP